MSEQRATGRRRSAASAGRSRQRSGSTGRRRAEVAPSPVAAVVRGAGHKAAIVATASGMALTVLLPTTAGASASGEPAVDAATAEVSAVAAAPVTAAAEVDLQFQRAGLTSNFDPDTKLEQVMVAAGSDAKAVSSEGTLSQPMDNMKMTSPFGMRVNPVTGYAGEMHTGQDYGAACGSPVYSAAGGKVKEAGWFGGYGNRVVVDHGNGLETTYNHLTSISAKVGDTVSRGELLAQSGTTGNSTGCHLHFEVVVNGDMVDPKGWL